MVNRFKAASDAGFKYVECTFPYAEGAEDLGEAKKAVGLEHVLINGWPGEKARENALLKLFVTMIFCRYFVLWINVQQHFFSHVRMEPDRLSIYHAVL